MGLERRVDLARLERAQRLGNANRIVGTRRLERGGSPDDAIEIRLHRTQRDKGLRHRGARAVAHAGHELQRCKVHVAERSDLPRQRPARALGREGVVGLGERAYRQGMLGMRDVVEEELCQMRRRPAYGGIVAGNGDARLVPVK